jgi:hypothetical protein
MMKLVREPEVRGRFIAYSLRLQQVLHPPRGVPSQMKSLPAGMPPLLRGRLREGPGCEGHEPKLRRTELEDLA